MSGFQDEIINFVAAVITPGQTHPWAIRILNFALIGLFFTLLSVVLFGTPIIHHYIMLLMTVVLFIMVHWFIRELDAVKKKEKEQEEKKKD